MEEQVYEEIKQKIDEVGGSWKDKQIDYLFVFKNGGWWLKIDSHLHLANYLDKTDNRFGEAFSSLINSKEFTREGKYHASAMAIAIGLYGQNRKMSPLEATMSMRNMMVNSQIAALEKYGAIYINECGGWHYEATEEKHEAFIRKKELVFPGFKENEIRVKQFIGGEHYYAYIGNMEVRDGDTVKWNTYEEAYNQAKRLLGSGE